MKYVKNKSPYHVLVAVCVGLIALVTVGMAQSSIGIFIAPLADHYGMGRGEVSTYVTLQGYVLMVLYFGGGKIMSKFSGRIWMPLGGILMGAGFLIMSQLQQFEYFYATCLLISCSMCLVGGLFTGTVVNNWFSKGAGLVLGIVTTVPNIGGIIWSPIGTVLIAENGVQFGYMILGIVALVVILPLTIFVVRFKPEEKGLLPWGFEATSDEVKIEYSGLMPKRALTTVTFWLCILFTFSAGSISAFATALPGMATSLGMDAVTIGLVASIGLAGSMVSKVGLGFLADRAGNLKSAIIACSIGFIGALLILFNNGSTMLMIGVFLMGFSFGMTMVSSVINIRANLGMRGFSVINGWGNATQAFSYYTFVSVYGFIYDFTGDYIAGIILVMVVQVLAPIILSLCYKTAKKYKSEW